MARLCLEGTERRRSLPTIAQPPAAAAVNSMFSLSAAQRAMKANIHADTQDRSLRSMRC